MANDYRSSVKKMLGRIPPHNDEAEAALLGAVLIRNKTLEDVQGMVVKEDFYQISHQLIWEAMSNRLSFQILCQNLKNGSCKVLRHPSCVLHKQVLCRCNHRSNQEQLPVSDCLLSVRRHQQQDNHGSAWRGKTSWFRRHVVLPWGLEKPHKNPGSVCRKI